MTGLHRAPWSRRRVALAGGLALVAAAVAGYFAFVREPPPDTARAGPGYWVSTRGSDDAPGTPGRPWRTVGHAVGSAPAGARIFLRAGSYSPFTVPRRDLTISSAPGERAEIVGRAGTRDVILITASGVTVADLTVRGCVPKRDPDVNVSGDHGSGIRVTKAGQVAIRDVTVRDSHGTNSAGKPVGCYGILVTESRDVQITGSELYHNGAGIVIHGGGRGVLVDGNNVHDQDVIVQNTAAPEDDFGGYGLGATFITDKPGPVFRGNIVLRNHGPSTDYRVDGGGMELYQASNTTVTGNTFQANDGVLETGTGAGGRCTGNVFTRNTAVGGAAPAGFDRDTGLVLRCAADSVISGNTFTDLDRFTFLLATGGSFAGSLDGLRITGNTVTYRKGTVAYRLQYAAGRPGVTIDGNRYRGGGRFAVPDGARSETAVSFADWRSRTGYDSKSTATG